MKNSKQIIGFINTTIKGYRIVFGEISEQKAHELINAIISNINDTSKTFIEVTEYVRDNYNWGYNK